MNPLDRLLGEELSRCLDRVAEAYAEGTLPFMQAHYPGLRRRIDEKEQQLAALRLEILDRHAAWQAGLKDLEDLWGLAELKRSEPRAA